MKIYKWLLTTIVCCAVLTVNTFAEGKIIEPLSSLTIGTTYNYVGQPNEQQFIAPADGLYRFDLYGESAGIDERYVQGGTASGTVELKKDEVIYITTGYDGRNGGGGGTSKLFKPNSTSDGYGFSSFYDRITATNGGGATHIATKSGNLQPLKATDSDSILIVAGGSAGLKKIESYKLDYKGDYTEHRVYYDGGFKGGDTGSRSSGYGYTSSIGNYDIFLSGGGGWLGGSDSEGGSNYASQVVIDPVLKYGGNTEQYGKVDITYLGVPSYDLTLTSNVADCEYQITGDNSYFGTISGTSITLNNIPKGNYNVNIYNPRYETQTTNTYITENTTLNFNLVEKMLELKGKLVNQWNNPVVNARVDYEGISTYTNESGEYSLTSNYQQDKSNIIFNKEDYSALSIETELTDNVDLGTQILNKEFFAVKGVAKDNKGNFISGVLVTINGISAVTDMFGEFKLNVNIQ